MPIGGRRIIDPVRSIGYGVDFPGFWIGPFDSGAGFRESHIAFRAPSRVAVQAFHDAAVALGADVLHAPRRGPEYHPGYFGAFVRDPDGNNVEAVHHTWARHVGLGAARHQDPPPPPPPPPPDEPPPPEPLLGAVIALDIDEVLLLTRPSIEAMLPT